MDSLRHVLLVPLLALGACDGGERAVSIPLPPPVDEATEVAEAASNEPIARPAERGPLRDGDMVDAPRASEAMVRASMPTRRRARDRVAIHTLVAGADSLYWLELSSVAEGRRPMTEARSSFVRLRFAGGPPTRIRDDLHAQSLELAVDASHVYWSRGGDDGLSAMPLGGGEIRTLAPDEFGARLAAGGGAVFFSSNEIHRNDVLRVETTGGPVTRIGQLRGSPLVVAGDHPYWVDDGCVVTAGEAGTNAPVFCGPIAPALASDGQLLYGAINLITADGNEATLYRLDVEARALHRLHGFDGQILELAAHEGRAVALLDDGLGLERRVVLVEPDGAATELAQSQDRLEHPALTAERAYWTRSEPDAILTVDVVEARVPSSSRRPSSGTLQR